MAIDYDDVTDLRRKISVLENIMILLIIVEADHAVASIISDRRQATNPEWLMKTYGREVESAVFAVQKKCMQAPPPLEAIRSDCELIKYMLDQLHPPGSPSVVPESINC